MLIKNAEELEDILDMSTENIEQLKEIGKNIDDAVLMRYIRIFSELTSKLRNITQKRVNVELALIKMCRPQMETDSGSILHRIRQIEEKLENDSLNFTEQQHPKANDTDKPKQPEIKEPKKAEKAAPEELIKICSIWKRIVSEIPNNLLKHYLPEELNYDSKTGENKLYIVIRDPQAKCYFTEHMDEAREETIRAIEEIYGKNVDIVIKIDNSGYEDLTKIPITEK